MAAARREANSSSCRSRTRRWRQRKKLGFKCRPVIPFMFSVNPFFPTSLACSLLVYDGITRKRGEGRLIEMRSRSAKQMCLSPQGTQRKNVRMENILEVSTISIEAPAGPKCYKLCEKIKLFRNSRFVYNVKFLELKL